MLTRLIAALMVTLPLACAHQVQAKRLTVEAESEEFTAAAVEYREIWTEDGARIVEILEQLTELRLESGPITVIVYEGVSFSGFRDIPMRMRASYPYDTKRGTLVHEISHRLISELVPKKFEDHPLIFLFLYDAWVELWGREFADSQVAIESRRRGLFDYEGAWKTALELSAEERSIRWAEFRRKREQQ